MVRPPPPPRERALEMDVPGLQCPGWKWSVHCCSGLSIWTYRPSGVRHIPVGPVLLWGMGVAVPVCAAFGGIWIGQGHGAESLEFNNRSVPSAVCLIDP